MQKNIVIESSTISAPKKNVVVVLVNEDGKSAFEVEKMVGKALVDRIMNLRHF